MPPLLCRAPADVMAGALPRSLPEPAVAAFARDVIGTLSRWSVDRSRAAVPATLDRPTVDRFCAALMAPDLHEASAMLATARAAGASHEDLCLHPLGSAAMRLADRWDVGQLGYADMGMAAGRILTLLRDMRHWDPDPVETGGRSALLATPDGQRGALCASLATTAADTLRDRGWDIEIRLAADGATLARAARAGGFALVGLAVSDHAGLGALGRAVVGLRLEAPRARVALLGPGFAEDAPLTHALGADAAASDIGALCDRLEGLGAWDARQS